MSGPPRLPIDARTSFIIAAALTSVFCGGLGAGWLLERYDAAIGFEREADRIAAVLELGPGRSVGDIRAGTGRWTIDMARRVGPDGEAFATVGPDPAHVLMGTVAESGLDNITVITRMPADLPRLPIGCCDAVLLRLVYSDLRRERAGFLQNVRRVVKPGGLVAVIDFHPDAPTGPPRNTLPRRDVIAEFTAAGFTPVHDYQSWFGNTYCVVFRRDAESTRDERVGHFFRQEISPAPLLQYDATHATAARYRSNPSGGAAGQRRRRLGHRGS